MVEKRRLFITTSFTDYFRYRKTLQQKLTLKGQDFWFTGGSFKTSANLDLGRRKSAFRKIATGFRGLARAVNGVDEKPMTVDPSAPTLICGSGNDLSSKFYCDYGTRAFAVKGESARLYLCPDVYKSWEFRNGVDPAMSRTMVHEFSHKFALTRDVAYLAVADPQVNSYWWHGKDDAKMRLTPQLAAENADKYAWYAYRPKLRFTAW